MKRLEPITIRDFRGGVDGINNNFSTSDITMRKSLNMLNGTKDNNQIGNLKQRQGYNYIGDYASASLQFVDGTIPTFAADGVVGLFSSIDDVNTLVAAVADESYTKSEIFLYNSTTSTWTLMGATALWPSATKMRFAQLGDYIYAVNPLLASTGSMRSFSAGTTTWGTTNVSGLDDHHLIASFQGRLFAATYFTDGRIYFSKPINALGALTWDTTNDWIRFGDNSKFNEYTALEVNRTLLVFKQYEMFSYDGVSTQPEALFQVGAVNQEVVKTLKGVTYFAGITENGLDVFAYDGSFPQEISATVHDWLHDFRPTSTKVTSGSAEYMFWDLCAWTDDQNYHLYIGDVEYKDGFTYSNVVLTYNIYTRSWTQGTIGHRVVVATTYRPRSIYFGLSIADNTDNTTKFPVIGDADGVVSAFGSGGTDNGTAIQIDVLTKEMEFGSRAQIKQLNKFYIYASGNYGVVQVEMRVNSGNWIPLGGLKSRVTEFERQDQGYYFEFRLLGSNTKDPFVFEGFEFPNVTIEDYEN